MRPKLPFSPETSGPSCPLSISTVGGGKYPIFHFVQIAFAGIWIAQAMVLSFPYCAWNLFPPGRHSLEKGAGTGAQNCVLDAEGSTWPVWSSHALIQPSSGHSSSHFTWASPANCTHLFGKVRGFPQDACVSLSSMKELQFGITPRPWRASSVMAAGRTGVMAVHWEKPPGHTPKEENSHPNMPCGSLFPHQEMKKGKKICQPGAQSVEKMWSMSYCLSFCSRTLGWLFPYLK